MSGRRPRLGPAALGATCAQGAEACPLSAGAVFFLFVSFFGVTASPGRESQLLHDTGHSASGASLRRLCLVGPREAAAPVARPPLWPPRAARGLVGRHRSAPAPPTRWAAARRWLPHRAVLSVSLSASSRRWPGRSLLAGSGCISGKTPRSGSVPLELASGQKQRYVRSMRGLRPPEGLREGSWESQPCTHVPGPRRRPPSEVQSSLSWWGSCPADPVGPGLSSGTGPRGRTCVYWERKPFPPRPWTAPAVGREAASLPLSPGTSGCWVLCPPLAARQELPALFPMRTTELSPATAEGPRAQLPLVTSH